MSANPAVTRRTDASAAVKKAAVKENVQPAISNTGDLAALSRALGELSQAIGEMWTHVPRSPESPPWLSRLRTCCDEVQVQLAAVLAARQKKRGGPTPKTIKRVQQILFWRAKGLSLARIDDKLGLNPGQARETLYRARRNGYSP